MTVDLERLEALLDGATPTPWSWRRDQPPSVQLVHVQSFGGWLGHPLNVLKTNENGDGWPPDRVDADLIVEAVNALPELIAAARRTESKPTNGECDAWADGWEAAVEQVDALAAERDRLTEENQRLKAAGNAVAECLRVHSGESRPRTGELTKFRPSGEVLAEWHTLAGLESETT